MLSYKLDAETRALMSQDPSAVKAAIAVLANQMVGADIANPRGIFKYEGGVFVNGKEIAIKNDHVVNDYSSYAPIVEPEESAVVWAITETARIIRSEGVAVLSERFGRSTYGDPLRDLLGRL